MMPVARYFVFVGGALMALLFAFDFFSPKAVEAIAGSGMHSAGTIDKSALRIRSEQKWPERIVFDTTQPTIVAKAVEVQTAPKVQAALSVPGTQDMTPTARVRETFAQFVPAESKKADAVVKKKKAAKGSSQPPLRLARYSIFGTSTW